MRIMKQDYGAVMMETILSLPVYIIMLAGIFWLGELAMARLALVSGENFALWQISNRHDGNTIPDFFSFMSNMNSSQEEVITRAAMQQNQFSTTDNAAANSWGKVIHGHSTISTRRSDWSAGADQSAQSMNPTDRNSSSTDNGSRVVFPRDSVPPLNCLK